MPATHITIIECQYMPHCEAQACMSCSLACITTERLIPAEEVLRDFYASHTVPAERQSLWPNARHCNLDITFNRKS